ncbi:MAG: CHAT domain-containing protein [Candidatus Flexifilum sp.]|jgi:hypothetical protein
MKLTFALTLTPLPASAASPQYTLTAESPAGRAQAVIALPFTEAEIAAGLTLLSRSGPKPTRADLDALMRDFGGRLFRALIEDPPAIRRLYDLTLERAGASGVRLLITSAVQPGRPDPLLRLPFELLRDPERDFLALSRATPIARGRLGIAPRPPADVTPPLRVLVVIASPDGLAPLDIEAEWASLNAATRSLQAEGLLTVTRLAQASAIAVQRRLRAEDFHVIHFIGHSDYDPAQDQGVLILEHEDGSRRPQLVTAEQIGRELGEETGIRLVVLNTCRSGQPAESDALRGLATNLAQRGVPAVVAMQFPISDSAARSFSEEFYHALADFMPIDEAVSEGRRAIVNRGLGLSATEWATPVLYLRSDDTVLFRRAASSASAARPPDGTNSAPSAPRWKALTALAAALGLLVLIALLFVPRWLSPVAAPTEPPTPALRPNLLISGLLVAPRRPAPGDLFRVNVTITNDGQTDSGPFTYTWDSSLTEPIQLNSFIGQVPNIPPGSSHSISIPFVYGWWGNYETQIVVDAETVVAETNELDNRRPFRVTVATDRPFTLDFTLLPDGPALDLPLRLDPESFARWNLIFSAPAAPDCAPQIVDTPIGVALTLTDACPSSRLTIDITRAAVSGAELEISGTGSASASFFADAEADTPLLTLGPVAIRPNAPVVLATPADAPAAFRRIVLSANGRLALTRLTLLPPPAP